jgi:hypothetical protein
MNEEWGLLFLLLIHCPNTTHPSTGNEENKHITTRKEGRGKKWEKQNPPKKDEWNDPAE